jgi:hypothetical protein
MARDKTGEPHYFLNQVRMIFSPGPDMRQRLHLLQNARYNTCAFSRVPDLRADSIRPLSRMILHEFGGHVVSLNELSSVPWRELYRRSLSEGKK